MYKFLVLVAAVASAQAGLIASPALAPGAITSQSQNILRSWGNLGQVSTYSKTIDTPWSSVSKSDIRVSNPGLTSQTIVGSPLLAQRTIVGSPLLAQRTIAAPALVGSPLLAQRAIAAPTLIGTAYSAAPAVSHMTYVNSLGLQYGW